MSKIRVDFKPTPFGISPGVKYIDADPETDVGGVCFYDEQLRPIPSMRLKDGHRFGDSEADVKNVEALRLYLKRYNKSEFTLTDEETVNLLSIDNEIKMANLITEVANLCKSSEELKNMCVALNIHASNDGEALNAVLQMCKANPDAVEKSMNSSDRHLLVMHRNAIANRVVVENNEGKFIFDNGKTVINLGTSEEDAIDYYKLNHKIYQQISAKVSGFVLGHVEESTEVIEEPPAVNNVIEQKEEKTYNLKSLMSKAIDLSIFSERADGWHYNEIMVAKDKIQLNAFLAANKAIQASIDKRV